MPRKLFKYNVQDLIDAGLADVKYIEDEDPHANPCESFVFPDTPTFRSMNISNTCILDLYPSLDKSPYGVDSPCRDRILYETFSMIFNHRNYDENLKIWLKVLPGSNSYKYPETEEDYRWLPEIKFSGLEEQCKLTEKGVKDGHTKKILLFRRGGLNFDIYGDGVNPIITIYKFLIGRTWMSIYHLNKEYSSVEECENEATIYTPLIIL